MAGPYKFVGSDGAVGGGVAQVLNGGRLNKSGGGQEAKSDSEAHFERVEKLLRIELAENWRVGLLDCDDTQLLYRCEVQIVRGLNDATPAETTKSIVYAQSAGALVSPTTPLKKSRSAPFQGS